MLQRTVAGAGVETQATSELRDLSRQLEGGLDIIEAAFERYRLLTATLRKRRRGSTR
ncbi:hypothetical protein JY651_48950 [Pyxidicoccus parkwayensis]|uniref:Uncharacterized protein n=1 Tax=Pyxidicoccus parkwayensis TaxID=2813578 RepID=A0ABX7NWX8_9BACT|nr:hypothetical protein [Pyxidicoccus parkwaysis]QSQ22941.1 hypothetical protein JY651_48950 [Pyxidicoccus parkwaysis]